MALHKHGNDIGGATLIDVTLLKENPDNPRTITEAKFQALVDSIRKFPQMLQLRPIVAKNASGGILEVLGGNMRLRACIAAGLTRVPVIMAEDLTPEQQREFIIKDNVGFGEWEWERLIADWPEAEDWGVDIPAKFKVLEAGEDDYEIPEEISTDIILGDLFEIGPHRLLCGDSINIDDVIRLIAGAKPDILFTDPPYNVSFNGRSGKFKVIKNDDLPESEFNDFIDSFLSVVKIINPQTYYICCNWSFYGVMQIKLKPKACIVWAKNVFGLGRGYRHQHEFILFDGFIDATITNESDLWEVPKDSNYKHPTQKPVAIPSRAIKNSSKEYNLVVDLFLGSGTTMVAAHQLNRKCYGMEIDPKYCQVIIDRMRKLDPSLLITKNGVPLENVSNA